MAILEIIKAPDPRLKQVAKPVATVDAALQQFLDDMLETMYVANGIGLAATQVGDLRRVLVIDVAQKEGEKQPMHLINPEIVERSNEVNVYMEGCLSFPQQFADVERPKMVKVRYLDYHGKQQELEADELLATCIQHEIDHLDGKVFVDHISQLKRSMIMRKLQKMKRFGYDAPKKGAEEAL